MVPQMVVASASVFAGGVHVAAADEADEAEEAEPADAPDAPDAPDEAAAQEEIVDVLVDVTVLLAFGVLVMTDVIVTVAPLAAFTVVVDAANACVRVYQ